MKVPFFSITPVTRKRLRRFREIKRAWWSLVIVLAMFAVSLVSELVANDKPLYIRFEGESYFPVFKELGGALVNSLDHLPLLEVEVATIYPADTFTGNELLTRPDYKAISRLEAFAEGTGNWMLWPPVRSGPHEIVDPRYLELANEVEVSLVPEPHVGTVDIRDDDSISRALGAAWFFGVEDDRELRDATFTETWPLPVEIEQAIDRRLANEAAPAISREVENGQGQRAIFELSAFEPRDYAPRTVRLTIREPEQQENAQQLRFGPAGEPLEEPPSLYQQADESVRAEIVERVKQRFHGVVDPLRVSFGETRYRVRFEKEDYRTPFRPIRGHLLGIDSSGRDVFARLLYGLRIAMAFGIILVIVSFAIGIVFGAIQGYYGGLLDITTQRLIEIWSALPFLYIIILCGSVFGRSFMLLLLVYSVFQWIGISYYMRAEFLKLRKEQYVEAAKCLGVPTWKILFKHILPNAMVPIITFFPFSLVGAIGTLTALDFLGFGLPPGTPSWGELFAQAQEFSYAWWLVLYPFLILFIVILLWVFVGEGVRAAYDPRRYSRME